nr:serine/threonine-protein kinase [Anabaena sphaerica]
MQNRYRVLKQLGQGGFGNTFEIDDGGKTKVLKVLTENNPKAVELFQQEAKVLSQLNSAGIPKVEADGYFTVLPKNSSVPLHCLVMEKIEGVNLEQWMEFRNYQTISETQALNWLKQIVEILALVHAKKYFHRDIKPQNIMLRPSGQLVLIDFGAVRQITTTILAGNSHTRIISQGYSPPEQQNGYSVQQSDFFALGRTFIFLLTGKEPQDKAIYDPLTNELNWRKYAVNISPLLADLIDNLIAPTANQRPENTRVILQRLKEIEQGLNQVHIFRNNTKIQSKNSASVTVAVSPGKPVTTTATKPTQKKQNPWQWLISLGVGCFAIAALNQPNNKIIVTTREDWDKLYKAEDLAKSPNVDNLLKAIRLAEAIQPESYVYQKSQELKSEFVRKMLKLAQEKMNEKDAYTALEIARRIPPNPELQAEVDDFIVLSEAKRFAFIGTVAGLEAAISLAQQIDASRDVYNEAQQLIARWQLELKEDAPYLYRAEQIVFYDEDIASLQKAITEASQIRSVRALYPEAQKKINNWTAKIQRIQDQSYLDQAKIIAESGDLNTAIWEAQKIASSGRALASEAQTAVDSWQEQQIRARENWRKAREVAVTGTPKDLAEAIRIADRVPKRNILRMDVNVGIDQWSQQILQMARSQSEFDIPKSIETARLIPRGSSAYRDAQIQIRTWKLREK